MWVDRSTGTRLQDANLRALSLVEAQVGPATFSTTPPAGAAVNVVAARRPGVRAPRFTLVRLSGGRIASTDLAGRPFVLAFFSADAPFDTADSPVRPVLDLQGLTRGGAGPTVVAVEVGERLARRGMPVVVPPGLSLPIGYDEDALTENAFGLTGDVAFAFVRSDGTVAETFDRAPTRAELGRSLAALR